MCALTFSAPRRREKSALLHRIVGTPTVVRDTDSDLITYSFRAEPAGFHEMFDDLELSYFHGHYTEVPPESPACGFAAFCFEDGVQATTRHQMNCYVSATSSHDRRAMFTFWDGWCSLCAAALRATRGV